MADKAKKTQTIRKSESMRDKANKVTEKSAKPRRIKKTASKIVKPLKAISKIGKKEYFLITPKETGFKGFLTKRRSFTPKYVISSYKELKLVSWPNKLETWRLMSAVFIFATLFALAVKFVDYGLDKLFRRAFL
ncbi:MAG: preprotein translocase subunit SecE [bacterium]